MPETLEDLARWMVECAEARLPGSQRTVTMKFTVGALRMWIDAVRVHLPKVEDDSPIP